MKGRLDSEFSGAGGSQSTKLISNCHYRLWSHLTSQEPCLPQVPFTIVLPSTFQYGDKSFCLPPSYHFFHQVVQSLLVRSTYQLHFIVTRVRHEKLLDIWPRKQQYAYLLHSALPSIYFHLSSSASSSLLNMHPEHGHRGHYSQLIVFSPLSKRPQRNGIRQ